MINPDDVNEAMKRFREATGRRYGYFAETILGVSEHFRVCDTFREYPNCTVSIRMDRRDATKMCNDLNDRWFIEEYLQQKEKQIIKNRWDKRCFSKKRSTKLGKQSKRKSAMSLFRRGNTSKSILDFPSPSNII